MTQFSPRYDAALALAARVHREQLRKGSDTPYITHVVHVSVLLLRHGFSEDLAIAGLLHDAVEDCDLDPAQLAATFGPDVARLVLAVSERKQADGALRPWEERKAEKMALVRAGGPDVAALKAADALHNIRSTIADLRREGTGIWARFRASPEQTLGYYQAILAAVQAQLDHPIVAELAAAVGELE
ncbi:MAG TPA: HD domain-containing protein, partial [Roseiflexaceae bacterium]|nr:HD domain-containing protein [Roseiflexaceae bacterium]